jgi:hypothetical protein
MQAMGGWWRQGDRAPVAIAAGSLAGGDRAEEQAGSASGNSWATGAGWPGKIHELEKPEAARLVGKALPQHRGDRAPDSNPELVAV